MKQSLLLTLIILFAHISKGQNSCGDIAGGWHLEMGNTYLPISYEVQTDSITTLNNLYMMANSLSGATNVRLFNNMIFLEVNNLTMNLNRYGLRRGATSMFALSPMNFKSTIQYFKGGYKVKISGIVSITPEFGNVNRNENYNWDYDFYNKEGCFRKLSYNAIINTLITTEKYFIDYFKL